MNFFTRAGCGVLRGGVRVAFGLRAALRAWGSRRAHNCGSMDFFTLTSPEQSALR